MKESSKNVLMYLKSVDGANVTAEDVANELGMTKVSVNGSFTAAIQRKNLGYRQAAEIELEDGTHKAVKFLKLTEEGMNFDPDAEEAKAE